NLATSIAGVTDGTSNTFMVVEDAGRPVAYTAYGAEPSGSKTVTGAAWADPDAGFALDGFTLHPSTRTATSGGSCAVNCSNRNEVYAFHPGGANMLFGDGSVRFFSSTLSIDIVAATLTRARGEVVDVSGF